MDVPTGASWSCVRRVRACDPLACGLLLTPKRGLKECTAGCAEIPNGGSPPETRSNHSTDVGGRRSLDIAPVLRSKAEARATYDRRSRTYERIEGRFERKARTVGEALLAVRPGECVLEIGSGPGESLVAFAHAVGVDGCAIGLDLAPEMHRVAATRLGLAGDHMPVSLVVGDGVTLPMRADAVDAAFASFTLELFDTPELPVVLAEVRRVLRPAGRVVIVSLMTTDPPAFMERAYSLAHRLMPRLADCRPIPVFDLLSQAGFRIGEHRRRDIVGIPVSVVTASVSAEG
jgi:ubiquinone/menaquinone biosynthesis C-methylase UbiE